MSLLQTRIDRAEAEWIARAKTERDAITSALAEWLAAVTTPEERTAFERWCLDTVTAEDAAIVDSVWARLPSDLAARLERADELDARLPDAERRVAHAP